MTATVSTNTHAVSNAGGTGEAASERASTGRVSRTAGGAAECHALHDAIRGEPWSGEIHGTDWLKTNLLPMQVKGLTAMLNQKATP